VTENPHGLVLPPELDPRGRRPARGGRLARALRWIAVVTSFSILAVSSAGYAMLRYYDGNIDRLPLAIGGKRPERAKGKALNFLLVGSDSREGMSAAELKQSLTEFTPGRRSDTMILVHLSGDRQHVTLVSFPRDAYVPIPAYKGRAAHEAKINTAFSIGGPALAIETVEAFTGIRVDHYIEVNFAGFHRIVDAVGGVDICLKKPAKEPLSGINLPAGHSRVRGAQALAFVRQRYGLPRGDLDRIARQQHFMGSLTRRAMSMGVLLNPLRLKEFLDVTTQAIQVDDGLSFDTLKSLALAMKGLDPGRVQFVTTPTEQQSQRRGGQSVQIVDEPAARALFESVRLDEPLVKPPAPLPGKLTVAPRDVRVTVLNGTGVSRRAAAVADDLRTVGFRVPGTGNADATTYDRTVIRYRAGSEAEAATLAASVRGARTELVGGDGPALTLVVGRDYTKAVAVKVTAPAQPTKPATPRPSGGVSKPPTTAADDACVA
jgi:LCP family protein required for cell wall assembly